MSAGQPPGSGEAAVNGTRLYYEVAGTGAPVVLVSGGGTLDRRQWDHQFEVLSTRFRVIRYDVRGIGRSARPTGEFSHHEDQEVIVVRERTSAASEPRERSGAWVPASARLRQGSGGHRRSFNGG